MKGDDLVVLFERNGLKRVDAKALAVFKDGRQRTTIDIEREASLRKPEVSAAMISLVDRGWFRQELDKKDAGKDHKERITPIDDEFWNSISRSRFIGVPHNSAHLLNR